MIKQLEQRVDQLEEAADNTEQYFRRPNLRVHGIAELADENTDQLIVKLVNAQMQFQPPIQLNQIERSHRLGPKTSADGRKRERTSIVRFRSERVRDEIYRSRFKLKTMVWYGMVWYGMVWYGMVWYGMVWYGMVWYGMVWYGMVWYGMVWYGVVWCLFIQHQCTLYIAQITQDAEREMHEV